MKRVLLGVVLLVAATAGAQMPVSRVAEDAIVIDRVAEVSRRDLPKDLLKRIIDEDVDVLRGKRADGTFEYATYERFEASRTTQSFSVQPRTDKMITLEMKGAWVYRAIVDVPKRRLLLGKNRPVWIERVDLEYIGQGKGVTERQTIEVKAWMQPGEVKPVDLPDVARQATVRVIAMADEKQGYGNVDVALLHAKIVDKSDSPYADAVASAKAVQRALDNSDVKSIRAMAQRMRDSLAGGTVEARGAAGFSPPAVPAVSGGLKPPSTSLRAGAAPSDAATQLELQAELQLIEDLLTGNESERREGMDRLHQMIRRLRR